MSVKKLIISIDVDIDRNQSMDNDIIASIHYPNEGNKIIISKGLNRIEIGETICHEIGHLIDWYLSDGKQSEFVDIREINANKIGRYIEMETILK
jgi:hypothetical protein